jgi:hypothetical protein
VNDTILYILGTNVKKIGHLNYRETQEMTHEPRKISQPV